MFFRACLKCFFIPANLHFQAPAESENEGKNLKENELIATQLARFRRKNSFSYSKVNDSQAADRLLAQFSQLERNDLNVLVVNFIDILSHARTEQKTVRELAADEAAYRSITLSWFRHSAMKELFKKLADKGFTVVVTTDHGSIRVGQPLKVIGDREVNTNLRYKLGKNLKYNAKEVFDIRRPADAGLPSPNLSTSYIFAIGIFCYFHFYSVLGKQRFYEFGPLYKVQSAAVKVIFVAKVVNFFYFLYAIEIEMEYTFPESVASVFVYYGKRGRSNFFFHSELMTHGTYECSFSGSHFAVKSKDAPVSHVVHKLFSSRVNAVQIWYSNFHFVFRLYIVWQQFQRRFERSVTKGTIISSIEIPPC